MTSQQGTAPRVPPVLVPPQPKKAPVKSERLKAQTKWASLQKTQVQQKAQASQGTAAKVGQETSSSNSFAQSDRDKHATWSSQNAKFLKSHASQKRAKAQGAKPSIPLQSRYAHKATDVNKRKKAEDGNAAPAKVPRARSSSHTPFVVMPPQHAPQPEVIAPPPGHHAPPGHFVAPPGHFAPHPYGPP